MAEQDVGDGTIVDQSSGPRGKGRGGRRGSGMYAKVSLGLLLFSVIVRCENLWYRGAENIGKFDAAVRNDKNISDQWVLLALKRLFVD